MDFKNTINWSGTITISSCNEPFDAEDFSHFENFSKYIAEIIHGEFVARRVMLRLGDTTFKLVFHCATRSSRQSISNAILAGLKAFDDKGIGIPESLRGLYIDAWIDETFVQQLLLDKRKALRTQATAS